MLFCFVLFFFKKKTTQLSLPAVWLYIEGLQLKKKKKKTSHEETGVDFDLVSSSKSSST